jgi:hypothetical protein
MYPTRPLTMKASAKMRMKTAPTRVMADFLGLSLLRRMAQPD